MPGSARLYASGYYLSLFCAVQQAVAVAIRSTPHPECIVIIHNLLCQHTAQEIPLVFVAAAHVKQFKELGLHVPVEST